MTRGAQRETVAMKTSKFRGSFDRREQGACLQRLHSAGEFYMPPGAAGMPSRRTGQPGHKSQQARPTQNVRQDLTEGVKDKVKPFSSQRRSEASRWPAAAPLGQSLCSRSLAFFPPPLPYTSLPIALDSSAV